MLRETALAPPTVMRAAAPAALAVVAMVWEATFIAALAMHPATNASTTQRPIVRTTNLSTELPDRMFFPFRRHRHAERDGYGDKSAEIWLMGC